MGTAPQVGNPQGMLLRSHRDGHGGARVTGGRQFSD
jgi:hypothetical protein